MEIKSKYINELLQNIKQLETRVTMVKQDAALSFSFFKDAFQTTQEVMRLLHELEMQQIEDMKSQMEKLVAFLSENENQKKQSESKPLQYEPDTDTSLKEEPPVVVLKKDTEPQTSAHDLPVEDKEAKRNVFAENIVLPTYINPRENKNETEQSEQTKTEKKAKPQSELMIERSANHLSVNDALHVSPFKIEVKRNLSLNDRFFYQRELFNNDREAMNSMMEKINSFATFEAVENYLKSNTSWDFEDKTVKGFLELLNKSQV